MNKKVLSLAICAALTLPTITGALSLGEIESNSHLNQPFRGKINLLSTNVAEAKKLRVRIAPPAVFNRVGIDRPAFLNSIRFRTSVQNGKPVILVTSNQPINEPFLNFLLEISWPNGQLLKEYTVLLDPPVLMTPNTAIASNTAGVRAEPQRRMTPAQLENQQLYRDAQRALQQPRRVVRAAQGQRSTARRASGSATSVKTYRVRRGDTLHKISTKLGYRGVSSDQMMLALFEKNKRAFINKNMNNLKAGVVLQRPSLKHAKLVSKSEAKQQRISQARAWRKDHATKVASNKATTKATKTTKSSQARMEVAGKTDVTAAKSAALAASGKASVDELRKQLVMTSEALQSRKKANEELKSRVSDMESLLRKKNRLISMKSQQLAKLQATVSGKPVKTEGADIEAVVKGQTEGKGTGTIVRPKTEETAELKPENAESLAVEAKAQEAIAAATQKAESAKLATESKMLLAKQQASKKAEEAKAKLEAESGGIADSAMGLLDSPDALKYGAGGGALLALLGGFWFMRRRNSYKEFSAEDYSEEGTEDLFNDDIDTTQASDFTTHDEFEHNEVEAVQDADHVKSETGNEDDDLLQEADVYIVYGLYDQAESELKEAINKSPNNLAYRKKLLESYKASGDKSAFEKEAKHFKSLDIEGKDKHWEEICEWGNALIPDSNLFEGSSVTAAATTAGVAMIAGTAVAQSDNEVDLEDLIGTADNTVEDEFENIDLDAILSEDMSENDFSDDNLIENMDALDLSAEPALDDFDFESESESNELDMEVNTDLDSLDSLLDEAVGDTVDTSVVDTDIHMPSMDLNLDSDKLDSILPEDNAFKSAELDSEIEVKEQDENLLSDFDDNLSFLDLDADEVIEETQIGTKIDLAKAYIDMGDIEGARSTLEEVMQDGSDEQKLEAEELLHHTG